VVTTSRRTGWTLTTASGVPVEPVERFLRHRFNSEASPNTLKAYAHDLKHFFTFLGEQQLDWRQVTQSAAIVEEQQRRIRPCSVRGSIRRSVRIDRR